VQIAGAGHVSGIWRLSAGDEPQQRRLARAVAADDADPLPGVDAESDGVQNRPRAIALGNGVEVDEVARRDETDLADRGSRGAAVHLVET
jgi:hypothetical protein